MIIINKFGLLKYKNLKFRCALGKAGIGEKKSEGDKITPKGTYKVVRIYYRSDRIKKVTSKFKLTDAAAEMKNGLLKISVPFAEEAKPKVLKIK